MTVLFIHSDGSITKKITIKELLIIPIWKGNRILDKDHVLKIKNAVGLNIKSLDHGYRIIKYNEISTDNEPVEQSYIIDGQHRLSVIRDHFSAGYQDDFEVLVTERQVASELDAIEYFNELNMVKPQSWTTDPNLISNLYIVALEKKFNTKKIQLIRKGNTKRPYLSSDKLREKLCSISASLKTNTDFINKFAERAIGYNTTLKTQYASNLKKEYEEKFSEKAASIGFFLGLDPKLKWVDELL